MEDSMSVNVPSFDLRSYCNTSKRRKTASSLAISTSSSRKACGVAIYRNINRFTDCNRVNIDISEIIWGTKDTKVGDICVGNVKVMTSSNSYSGVYTSIRAQH
ncbi:hypothetical protein TNCT_631171 [Trichonephila clavata]|uniref:Uncharacterized protein n=1 Tax=Trichonephila clavata TaxID=2740835 RepID=A0A8X6H6X7_TRICU|nr:hypothetical protein TNCT_631171 [Trichonephila clavata]